MHKIYKFWIQFVNLKIFFVHQPINSKISRKDYATTNLILFVRPKTFETPRKLYAVNFKELGHYKRE